MGFGVLFGESLDKQVSGGWFALDEKESLI